MRVRDIVDRKYPSAYADELATKVRAILRSRGLRVLPVVDERKRLIGVVSRSDLMAITSSISPIRVKGIMLSPSSLLPPLRKPLNLCLRKILGVYRLLTRRKGSSG